MPRILCECTNYQNINKVGLLPPPHIFQVAVNQQHIEQIIFIIFSYTSHFVEKIAIFVDFRDFFPTPENTLKIAKISG